MKLEDIDRALGMMRFLGEQRHPVRIELTNEDYQRLLASLPLEASEMKLGACAPLASLRGLPIFYGEESVVVYSTGQRIKLTLSQPQQRDPGGDQ